MTVVVPVFWVILSQINSVSLTVDFKNMVKSFCASRKYLHTKAGAVVIHKMLFAGWFILLDKNGCKFHLLLRAALVRPLRVQLEFGKVWQYMQGKLFK